MCPSGAGRLFDRLVNMYIELRKSDLDVRLLVPPPDGIVDEAMSPLVLPWVFDPDPDFEVYRGVPKVGYEHLGFVLGRYPILLAADSMRTF